MINIRISLMAFVAALSLACAASAQSTMPDIAPAAGATATADAGAASELSEGEIRKVDKDNKKLTIKHGPLKILDMPGMSMVFPVKDDAVLDKFQTGEKVRFQAEKIDWKIVVTKIEAVR